MAGTGETPRAHVPPAPVAECDRGASSTAPQPLQTRHRRTRAALGAWAVREVASFHLERVARACADKGLPLMVLKGMWLQEYAYAAADERPFADLDLLVARDDLAVMDALLVGLGYGRSVPSPGDVARLYTSADGFPLDVHYDLFPDGLFRLRGRDLLRAGLVDTRLAGVPVLVPAPYDGFAHLVGHFAKGRHGPRDTKLLRDFEELGRAFDLQPDLAARHLVAGGLRRAALYALQFTPDPQSFAARTLAALPADGVGTRLVRALGVPTPSDQLPRHRDRFFAFALDHDLPSGAGACGRRVTGLLREGGARRLMEPLVQARATSAKATGRASAREPTR